MNIMISSDHVKFYPRCLMKTWFSGNSGASGRHWFLLFFGMSLNDSLITRKSNGEIRFERIIVTTGITNPPTLCLPGQANRNTWLKNPGIVPIPA